jgi:hypothetical protein
MCIPDNNKTIWEARGGAFSGDAESTTSGATSGAWAFLGSENASIRFAWRAGFLLPFSTPEMQGLLLFVGTMSKGDEEKNDCRIR